MQNTTEQRASDRFIIKPATPEDGLEMLDIYEEEMAPGNPTLLFTRQEDPVASMLREGESVVILTCRERTSTELVGFGAFSINTCFIQGEPRRVGYLFGMKVRRKFRYRIGRVIPAIYNRIRQLLALEGIDQVVTTILSNNHSAQRLLTRPHRHMPRYIPLGRYTLFAISTKNQPSKKPPAHIAVLMGTNVDKSKIEAFYHSQGKNRNFFPSLKPSPALPADFFDSCIVLTDQLSDHIIAVAYVWDQRSYKQYRVGKYAGFYKMAYTLSPVLRLCGFPALPATGQILNMCTLSFILVRDERSEYFDMLVDAAQRRASHFELMLIGLGPYHPHLALMQKRRHWAYTSEVYAVSWNEQPHDSGTPTQEIPTYLECGRL